MASILKATSIIGAKALKPSSRDAKHVRDKLECLSKECTEKGAEEAPPKADKSKGDKGKGVVEEPPKKRKLSHNSYSTGKFGSMVDHLSKAAAPPTLKLLEASIKVMKMEAMHRANEKARKENEEKASKTTEKAPTVKTLGKPGRFLTG